MNTPPIISQIELTSEDAARLRKKLIAVGIFFVITSIMFGFMVFGGHFDDFDAGIYVLIGFGVFFFGIIFYIGGGIALDLFKGEKLVIKGQVADKIRYKSSNSSRGSRGGGRAGRSRGSRSSSSPKYYLKIGDKKYYVDHKHYAQAHVGQQIELHYAKHSNSSLKVRLLSEDGSFKEPEKPTTISDFLKHRNEIVENLPKKEMLLSQEDLKYLKKHRNRLVRQNGGFSFFFGLMAFIFTAAGLLWWVMWIAAAVLWLVWLLFIRALLKVLTKFRNEEASGLKLVILTKIKDKQHHTGSYRGHYITTDYGRYAVSRDTYESVKGQEPVFLSVGKHSGWLIDIQTKSNHEYLNY